MRNRPGFSLIEVIVALVVLAVGILSLQSAVLRMIRQVGVDTRATAALRLVQDRLELVQADPQYDQLETRYETTETNPQGMTGLTRQTDITAFHDSTAFGITDYKRITVVVRGTGLLNPISRTVAVGSP